MTTRRDFLKNLAIASLATTGLGAVSDLRRIAAAATLQKAEFSDYKALVCLFMYGGNDANNMVIPTSATEFAQYQGPRGVLALPRASVLPITVTNTPGREFALHPAMPHLAQVVNTGRAAIVANVGPLLAPTTRAQWQNRSVPLPMNLFSHSDQQGQWQSAISDEAPRSGWGGRIGDLLKDANGTNTSSTLISVAGNNLWENGNTITSYKVSANTGFGISYYKGAAATDPLSRAVNEMLGRPYANVFERTWVDIISRSIQNQAAMQAALAGASITTAFPDSGLGDSLQLVARLIAARGALGVKRQTFFVSIGGFDTHGDEQLGRQNELLGEVSAAVRAFYDATIEMGISQGVTLFTASDFNRNFPTNGKGSDHAWGSHHFVVGGSVYGGAMYGTFPTLAVNGPDDAGQGRWIPTTSVDEFGATLARWFGVAEPDLHTVFPKLSRFARPNLGFLAV